MSLNIPTTPEWLKAASSVDHIIAVLQILTQREHSRHQARDVSRQSSNPSTTHRLTHSPSVVAGKIELKNHYSISAGTHPNNAWGNRYADIEPYDRTRVTVSRGESEEERTVEGRYLNANWTRELAGGKWWIATQAPLPQTAHAFLSVILQPITRPPRELHPIRSSASLSKTSRVRTVVQLTRHIESGMRKAHIYFPPNEGQSWIVPPEPGCNAAPLKVSLLKTRSRDEAHCVQSMVSIQSMPLSPQAASSSADGDPVIFQHLLYESWPDHGVPQPEGWPAFLNFVKLVDDMNRDTSSQPHADDLDPDPPIMVGCSAGVGRTGAFIVISSLLRKYGILSPSSEDAPSLPPLLPSPLGPLPAEIQGDLIAQEIDALREQRPGMIQRESQVTFLYDILNTVFAGYWRPSESGGGGA